MPVEVGVRMNVAPVRTEGQRAALAIVTLMGLEYANEVKRLMKTSRPTGRVYRRGRKTHVASAPGQPPAPDTGDLVKSIRTQTRVDEDLVVVEAGSALKKARWLEFGAARVTATGATWILFPRPAWGPAMQTIRANSRGIAVEALRRSGLVTQEIVRGW